MKKIVLIILAVVIVILGLIGVVFFSWPEADSKKENNSFDPSIYYEGDSVSQEEIDSVLTDEERKEIEDMFNEESKSSN